MPQPGNVLDYHRYAYVRYNPLKYNDPTGHQANGCTTEGGEVPAANCPSGSLSSPMGGSPMGGGGRIGGPGPNSRGGFFSRIGSFFKRFFGYGEEGAIPEEPATATQPRGVATPPPRLATFIRTRNVPDITSGGQFQRSMTGKNVEEGWRLQSGREVWIDDVQDNFVMDYKFAGYNAKEWEGSGYNPASRGFRYAFNEAQLVDEASRQIEFARDQGLIGVRWVVSYPDAKPVFENVLQSNFGELYSSGFIQVQVRSNR